MNRNTTSFLCFIFVFILFSCKGQVKNNTQETNITQSNKSIVGGGCDGCELMFIDMPSEILSIDTSEAWNKEGEKLLIKGTAYKQDQKTLAPNIIIYYWHTDNNGYYTPITGMTKEAERHGHLRGWVKTDSNGSFAIYTIRPAAYPDSDNAEHIHIAIKEPNIDNEYYIDALVFYDDPLLTQSKRNDLRNRGGSGILQTIKQNQILVAEHNIILGLNIPNYPK